MQTEAFSERLFDALLGTFTALTVTLGDQLGLYDELQHRGPLTADELADQSRIHPRYAQEWLEQQTVAGILAVDDPALPAEERRYAVPEEHAPVLTDQDSLLFFRPFFNMATAAAMQVPALLEAYRTGVGVAWHQYGDLMRRGQGLANRPLFLDTLGREWLPSIPDVHERLAAGGRVADIGCGEGWSSIGMALAYPNITVDGFDIDKESVDTANAGAKAYGLQDRVRAKLVDGSVADTHPGYDLVTAFECIHDMGDPVGVLSHMREIVKEDGAVVVMDERVLDAFTGEPDPVEQLFYGFSTLVCLPDGMSHEGSAATGTVMRLGTLRRYAGEAGFSRVDVLPIEHETFRFYRLHR